jgi:hypothetical protein
MNSITIRFLLAILLGIFVSCSSSSTKQSDNTSDTLKDSVENKSADTITIVDGGIPIFYNMYLSVEMSSMFQSLGATYNPKLLNSHDKTELYETSTDKALNLGVYAVDLSYSKYFDQFNEAGKYLKNMQKMSSELGIPSDKFYLSLKRIENNLANKDSLIKIANDIYKTTEEYLKQSDRGSAAALVITGGWLEAMYIATSLVKKNNTDIELIERISEQKHSIADLISLLEKYNKEPYIRDLLIKMADIRESLNKLVVDKEQINKAYTEMSDITVKIWSLRKEIVN